MSKSKPKPKPKPVEVKPEEVPLLLGVLEFIRSPEYRAALDEMRASAERALRRLDLCEPKDRLH